MVTPSRGSLEAATLTASTTADRTQPLSHASGSSRLAKVCATAEERLRRSGYLALRDVTCEVDAETFRLRGRLPTYYLKQVAQAIVSEIAGVRHLDNLIVVVPSRHPPV